MTEYFRMVWILEGDLTGLTTTSCKSLCRYRQLGYGNAHPETGLVLWSHGRVQAQPEHEPVLRQLTPVGHVRDVPDPHRIHDTSADTEHVERARIR